MKISFPHREIETQQTQLDPRKFSRTELPCRLLSLLLSALSRHCVLRYFSARVCSVNLQLLTHTTPLFCYFYFKLFFSKTLGLVVIYDLRVLFALLYNSRLPSRPSQPANSTAFLMSPGPGQVMLSYLFHGLYFMVDGL